MIRRLGFATRVVLRRYELKINDSERAKKVALRQRIRAVENQIIYIAARADSLQCVEFRKNPHVPWKKSKIVGRASVSILLLLLLLCRNTQFRVLEHVNTYFPIVYYDGIVRIHMQ